MPSCRETLPKWCTRREVAEIKKTQFDMMCFTFNTVEFVDDKFMKEWVIGGKIVLPPDADLRG